MRSILAILAFCCLATQAAACETALVLAVDVSGSIDAQEYQLETGGLAAALDDPSIAAALVADQDAVAVVLWSGVGVQYLAQPWQRMESRADVARFADGVRAAARPQGYNDTAIGDAILYSIRLFGAVPDCRRTVIDISGDGIENATNTLEDDRAKAEAEGVTINAIAIEAGSSAAYLAPYFRYAVITADGFVITAKGLPDYPRAIHDKLLRELTKPAS